MVKKSGQKIFKNGPKLVQKWSKMIQNGLRNVQKWSKNGQKMVKK